jgi:hypothetical protein
LPDSTARGDSLAAGDKVTIFVNPQRDAPTVIDGSRRGLYVGIILADGSTLGTADHGDVGGSR